jgi:probable phosphoglycerate mutase
MVLTLSLVRHRQTQYSRREPAAGRCDSPLTPRGLAGVRSTAAHLAGRQFTAAYVSPCGRAQATAHEILAHHPSALAVTDPDLREFCFGDLETRPEAEPLDRYHPDSMFAEVLDGTFAGIPGGELGRDFLARVRSAFTRIESKPWHGSRSRREPRAAGGGVPDMLGASPTPTQV